MRLRSITVASVAAVSLICSTMVSRTQAAGLIPLVKVAKKNSPNVAFVIKRHGSYVLTHNIRIKHANEDVLDITAPNVTLNMQGFSIIGTGTTGTGVGIRVVGDVSNVTITNGTVTQMSGGGIVLGANSVISSVKAMQNLGVGIQAGPSSELTNNVSVGNADDGLMCANDCLVTGNVSTGNAMGLSLGPGSGYGNNVLDDNTTTNVSGGVSLGHNVCSGALC